MRAVLLRSLAVIAAGGLALAGVLYVASTVDARSPTVLEIRLTAPAGEDDRVALITTSFEIAFSEPVMADGAAAAVSLEPAVPGAVSWSGSTMIFTPREPLELEREYRLLVGIGIRDRSGNPMADLPPPFEFRTAGRPALASSSPAEGDEEVPTDAPIALTFSTLMDTASVEAALSVTPRFEHELRWSGRLLEIVPGAPLQAGAEYEVAIGREAADVAGVTIGEPISLTFRTSSPGLEARTLVPADEVDGIAPISPIAVIFDRPIDPGSISDDMLIVTPEVAGTLEVAPVPGDPPSEDGAGRLLRFTPSAPLPPNTTFEVQLTPSPASTSGGTLPGALEWSFTTGAPAVAISNGITFLSDRAGIANVWVMNPDGTGQRQLTAELTPVIEYAVAPDGSSLVAGDGAALVYQRADGTGRRLLTQEGALEFDPSYAPDGTRIAFARVDAASDDGLGLWEWSVEGGDPVAIELPAEEDAPEPSPGAEEVPLALRSPRYSPDGDALAFVDGAGRVGILELESEELSVVEFTASAPPAWMPDSSSVLLTGSVDGGSDDQLHRLARGGTLVTPLLLGDDADLLAVAADGRLAVADDDGRLHIVERPAAGIADDAVLDEPVAAAAFAPGGELLVVALAAGDGELGPLELLDPATGERTSLAPDGGRPRWLP